MDIQTIKNKFSMPIASPSYPKGPYEFLNREYMIITYLSDPDAIREALPEPLEPDGSNQVLYEFIKMPDSSGFGDYEESGVVIPCQFQGTPVNFTAQMYLDCDPPIAGGREIWGFPKKDARPCMQVIHDTLTGRLCYADQLVALGTMTYKHKNMIPTQADKEAMEKRLQKMQVNLKMIPHVSGEHYDVLQLIGYTLDNIRLKSAHTGDARLHLIPHVNAPVADLPVRKIVGGLHFLADITLPLGHVLHDYL
ncbi:acetoacetate decarboxylase [Candidatus Hepatobacter penaei]|uniref:acetoacetate decarboxylase n=1 Tax=Candidatus Hepatobacter penaei TaxID=1274402 RepID=UPI0004F2F50A|nr:acetoacetate decarboxylase [Candidatus Hepatobacter penaei]TGW15535.1 acetoacetate decarboxylase [bacterium NHP-B]